MPDNQIYTAIGLMSGSSHDGVDAALIKTDGHQHIETIMSVSIPYARELRNRLGEVAGLDELMGEEASAKLTAVEDTLTRTLNSAIYELLAKSGMNQAKVDFIGYGGHIIQHDPAKGICRQIGNAQMIADEFAIPVITEFRKEDVAAGGQGAPLTPIYHHARAAGLEKPLGIVDMGGVAHLTYLGEHGEIIAFDSGPANALIDDWMYQKTGKDFDENGETAKKGRVDVDLLKKWLGHDYFKRDHKKSLGRNDFKFVMDDLQNHSLEDGAATLTAFTVDSVLKSLDIFPQPPTRWLIAGGGRRNEFMMYAMMCKFDVSVEPFEAAGINGDAVEAESFAYLAVRRFLGEPISFPTTTGVPSPMTGGTMYEPTAKADEGPLLA